MNAIVFLINLPLVIGRRISRHEGYYGPYFGC